ARTGRLFVRVEFDWSANHDFAVVEVNRAVAALKADSGVDELQVRRFDPRQLPVVVLGLTGRTPEQDLSELRTLAERQLAPALEQLDGVAEARVTGGRIKQIRVRIDPVRLR